MAEAPTMTREEAEIGAPPAETGKVPLGRKAAWGIASIPDQLVTNGIGTLALPIYNLGLGIDPRLLGWALALPRVLDAVIDPAIGNISDNARTRWGRRRPFIFVGGILLSVFFMLMWMPPKFLMGKSFMLSMPAFLGGTMQIPQLAVYFLVTSMLCYFGYAIFAIPRQAMGIELSTDYHERTSIFAMNSFFAYLAGFLMPWLYHLSFTAGRLTGGNEIAGVRYVAVGVGLIMLVCALAPALLIRERSKGLTAQPKTRLIDGFKMTFSNYPFWLMFFIIFLILLASSLVGPMNLYISIDYVCGGDKKYGSYIGGWNGTMQGVVGLAMTPVIAWTAHRIGKKATMLLGQLIALTGFIGSWWLFTPRFPYLQLVETALVNVGLACVWVLSGSVMADICDTDELKYGLRREGMFGAVFQFLMKTSTSCVVIVAGYSLVWAGYQAGKIQTIETLTRMRVLFIVITVACLAVSIVLTLFFPITEKSARETRAVLDARNGGTAGADTE